MKEKANQNRDGTWMSRLLALWRPGMVLTSPLLTGNAIPPKGAHYLRSTGILATIGDGAYCKKDDTPHWPGVCSALQSQLNLPLHIGGRSALGLQGITQYQELGQTTLWLFAERRIALPKWFLRSSWDFTWHFTQANLFAQSLVENTCVTQTFQGFNVSLSKRERAILEMIHLIGKHHRFEEVDELFESLITLDPMIVQNLLLNCKSIKVCRVFLYLTNKHKPSWQKELDESKINLGSGKREVVKGGQLDSRYLITVPKKEDSSDV